MAWKIDGKIAAFLPNNGNPQQDTFRVVYTTPTGEQKEIEKVYFLSPSDIAYFNTLTTEQKLAELATGKYDVWHRYFAKILLAGNQNVAIEYDLTDADEDLVINSIEIFTDSSASSTARIKILHESGLYVAAIDGDTKGSETVKYDLTGRTRTVSGLSITLYKGHKYYFVYQGNSNTDFYPAYFQDDTDGNYKVYSNTQTASQINVGDLSVLGNFLGGLGPVHQNPRTQDYEAMINMQTNDSFLWLGATQQGWNPALNNNHFYKRKTKTYTYTKTINVPDDVGTANYRLAKILAALKGTNITALQLGDILNWFSHHVSLVQMKSDWASCIDSDANEDPISLSDYPSSPIKGLYYVNNEVQVYDGNNWSRPFQWNMSPTDVETYLNYPDWWNKDFEDMNINYTVDTNFANTSVETPGKHFYLKINGNEV